MPDRLLTCVAVLEPKSLVTWGMNGNISVTVKVSEDESKHNMLLFLASLL